MFCLKKFVVVLWAKENKRLGRIEALLRSAPTELRTRSTSELEFFLESKWRFESENDLVVGVTKKVE